MKIKGFSKNFWILLMMVIVLGAILWGVGGSRLKDEAPYYLKKVLGETGTVSISGQVYYVELARTTRAKEIGLSNREYIGVDKGMLFVFDEPGIYSFTMKDTSISLDIIWILDGKISHIVSRAMPGDQYLLPPAEADYVLEIRPGNAGINNWKIGDQVEINLD